MKGWSLLETGKMPECLEISDPQISSEKQDIVEISYSSLNHRDVWIMKGKYPGIKFPCILGSDACGSIHGQSVVINPGMDWGENEKAQANEYSILGMPLNGTFADSVLVNKSQIHNKPQHLTDEEAAALPLAGVTAYRAFVVKCKPEPGKKVLITGIGGGVALWALQMAVALDCEVYVTSGSFDKIRKAISLGAIDGVCSKEADWDKELLKKSGGFDIVVDSIMGNTLPALIKLCLPGADLSFYGASAGNSDNFQPHPIFWKQITMHGSTMGSDSDFKNMLEFVEQYKIRPVIDQVFNFSQLHLAIERMDSGLQFGKIVIDHSSK